MITGVMKTQRIGDVLEVAQIARGGDATPDAAREDDLSASESKHDIILIERVLRGDKDAYRQLVEKYQQRAFVLALEVVRSREDAEDIVQEAFVKAYLSLSSFKQQSAFYTWLYRIVYNMAIDHRRKVARRGGQALSYDESAPAGNDLGNEEKGVIRVKESEAPGPHELLLQKEQAAKIRQAFSEVSEEHRLVITLREVDGMSYDEIAETMGVAKGTVMSRLFYARKKLQEALTKE